MGSAPPPASQLTLNNKKLLTCAEEKKDCLQVQSSDPATHGNGEGAREVTAAGTHQQAALPHDPPTAIGQRTPRAMRSAALKALPVAAGESEMGLGVVALRGPRGSLGLGGTRTTLNLKHFACKI